jgi:ribosomal protein L37AE/L43A
MVRVNADYIRFVHGDAARLGHRPAMRLIDLASERQKPVCWSCGEKDDIRIINRVTAVCRSCGTGIGWEHQHEERDHGYTDDKAEG